MALPWSFLGGASAVLAELNGSNALVFDSAFPRVRRTFQNLVKKDRIFVFTTQFISEEIYLQHNTQIADGLSGSSQAIEAMQAKGINMVYTKNHTILSEGEFGGEHVFFYDLFRVAAGKIAEHWGIIEHILGESERKNTNGKFDRL